MLNANDVEYVVVGGHAVAYHGYPRFTGDIDFFVRPSPENAQRVVDVLVEFGFEGAGELSEDLTDPSKVVQLGRPPNRIDILTGLSGIDFDDAWGGSVQSEMDGVPVRIIGRAMLLKNKRESGRAKDLADAEEIERTNNIDPNAG
ncbi:MAG: nucleotidyltransferase [Planctomycetota bacterium]